MMDNRMPVFSSLDCEQEQAVPAEQIFIKLEADEPAVHMEEDWDDDEEFNDYLLEEKLFERLKNGEDANEMLIEVCRQGRTEAVELLLDAGADVNAADKKSGQTALMAAIEKGCLEAAHVLMDAGADVRAVDTNGKTALMYFCERGEMDGVWDFMLAFLIGGGDVYAETKGGWTAWLFAFCRDALELTRMLENFGVRGVIDVKAISARDEYGRTPLIRASQNGCLGAVRALLRAGADVNAADRDGDTALMYAVRRCHVDVAKTLIDARADVDAKNKWGRTAMMYIQFAAERMDNELKMVFWTAGAKDQGQWENRGEYLMYEIFHSEKL